MLVIIDDEETDGDVPEEEPVEEEVPLEDDYESGDGEDDEDGGEGGDGFYSTLAHSTSSLASFSLTQA